MKIKNFYLTFAFEKKHVNNSAPYHLISGFRKYTMEVGSQCPADT